MQSITEGLDINRKAVRLTLTKPKLIPKTKMKPQSQKERTKMQQELFNQDYPIYTTSINKTVTTYKNIPEILAALQSKIEAHPVATYIGTFNHYEHTSSLGEAGEIADEIIDAQNLLCCFGKSLMSPKMLAARPRSIGVAELSDSFVISFLKAPNPTANEAMEKWIKALQNV